MTLQERCRTAEAKLEEISTALLECRTETLERCEGELQEIAALLHADSLNPATLPGPEDRAALIRFRKRGRLLSLQAQHAANLCQGWAQLGVSEGYSPQGQPVLPRSEPQTSYEV